VDRGILTYDERLLRQQPGLGIAREQAGAMRDVAGINRDAQLGVAGINREAQGDLNASNERVTQLKAQFDRDIASGNDRAAIKSAKLLARAQEEAARIAAAPGLAETAAYKDIEGQKIGILEGERMDKRDERLMELASQDEMEAERLSGEGRYEEAAAARQRANQRRGMMQGMGGESQGIPQGPSVGPRGSGKAFSNLPAQARKRYAGATPQETIANLQRASALGEIDIEQAEMDAFVQELFPGTPATTYNPEYGVSDVWGAAGGGGENMNRIGWMLSGRGPKPPTFPGTNIPYPVIPGALGVAQTYMGY
jgi:hypothetical protein